MEPKDSGTAPRASEPHATNGNQPTACTPYSAVFRCTHDGILVVETAGGTIREANPAAEHLYGYAPGMLAGVPLHVIAPEFAEGIVCAADGDAPPAAAAHIHCTGHTIPVDVTVCPPGLAGPGAVILIVREAAGSQQAAANIRRRLDLETMLAEIAHCFINVDPETFNDAVMFAGKSVSRLFPADIIHLVLFGSDMQTIDFAWAWSQDGAGAVVTEPFRGVPVPRGGWLLERGASGEPIVLSGPDDLPADALKERRVWIGRGLGPGVLMPLVLNIDVVGVLVIASPETGRTWSADDQRVLRVLAAVLMGALARQWADEVIRETPGLVEMSHDAILVRQHEGEILRWNGGARDLYGWPASDVRALHLHSLLRTETPGGIEAVDAALDRNGAWQGELTQSTRDGRKVVVDSRQVVLRNRRGHRIGVLEVNRDITERKEAEHLLQWRLAAEELVNRISVRFTGGTSEEFDGVLDYAIGEIGQFSEAAHAYIVHFSEEREWVHNQWDWFAHGNPPRVLRSRGASLVPHQWVLDHLDRAEEVFLRVDETEPVAAQPMRDALASFGLSSLIVVPIFVRGEVVACLGLSATTALDTWSVRSRELLRLARAMLENAFERQWAADDLRWTSVLVTHAHDAVIGIDARNVVTDWNRGAEELYGWTAAQAVNSRLGDLLHPRTADPGSESISTVLARDGRWDGEVLHTCKDGRVVTVDSRRVVMRGDFGEQKRMLQIDRDVTARLEAERSLRRSQESYRSLVETISDWIWEIDASGVYTYASPRVVDHLGYQPQEIVGRSSFDHVLPENQERTREAFHRAVSKGERLDRLQHVCVRKDGGLVTVESSGLPFFDSNGGLLGYRGVDHDVTERNRMEEALWEALERFRFALSNTSLVMYNQDRDLRFTWIGSPPPGVDPASAIGCPDATILPVAQAEALARIKRRVIERGKGETHQMRLTYAGSERHWDLTFEPLTDQAGGIHGVTTAAVDITDHKRIEANLRRSLEELRLLAGRMQSVREEERATVAREIHDDLGQALTGLKLDTDWMRRRFGDPNADAGSIRDRLAAMSELIDQTIGSVRRIATELRPAVLDTLGLVPAIEWQVRDFEMRTGIRCQTSCSVANVNLDHDCQTGVFRIVQEALTNVARHAEATQVIVRLRFAKGQMVLSVRDNGRGIRKQEVAGRGSLGILGMRERATAFGGIVSITGSSGRGTAVSVSIPIAE